MGGNDQSFYYDDDNNGKRQRERNMRKFMTTTNDGDTSIVYFFLWWWCFDKQTNSHISHFDGCHFIDYDDDGDDDTRKLFTWKQIQNEKKT